MTFGAPTLFWIVGRGGLLGRRLPSALAAHVPGGECWNGPAAKFSWGSPELLAEQLRDSAVEFAAEVRQRGCGWGVLWTAGAGVIGTGEDVLAAETATWEMLLALLDIHLLDDGLRAGLVFLASSAGGIYGNCPDPLISELSEGRPMSAYGHNKRRQEEILNNWADGRPDIMCRIGRISNLYGPGQNLAKPQGLISHISRCLIAQQPIHVYVPLDTIRDYIYVEDCARQIACCVAEWSRWSETQQPPSHTRVKLFAAEEPTTVAAIIGEFTRLSLRRHPRVICAPSALGLQQPRRLRFQSVMAPHVGNMPRTSLQVGISQVHHQQMKLYRDGRLVPSAAKSG